MIDTYTLYGSYASYYTAKSRSYLRKKGIPFVERLPSDPEFRATVRATSGTARIPQLLTPQGEVIQDSVEILDALEARFPQLPAIPTSPRQRVFVHVMELLASEGLVRLAWMHRWLFEGNLQFVKMDFGRSFRPQGNDQELLKYGQLIADRMMSHGLPEASEKRKATLDQQYLQLLALFETHLTAEPYLLGGHPSAADYAMMGALHAHLGRDPVGLRMMQNNAPRVFRWVEHMLVPEIQSPEFYDRPVVYPADDAVPGTSVELLNYIAQEFGRSFVLDNLAFNQLVEQQDFSPGVAIDPDNDQPVLPSVPVTWQGESLQHASNLYAVWLLQRTQSFMQTLSPEAVNQVLDMVGPGLAADLIASPMLLKLQRVKNRLVVADRLNSRPLD